MRTRKIPTNIKNESLVKKRRRQIFVAVVKLFSKKGYHGTTLREISKETGITLGNLYDYITTKEDILLIIHEGWIEAWEKAISKEKEQSHNPVEKLRRLINIELDTADKYQDLAMIMYQESHAMSRDLLHPLLSSERHRVAVFEKVIAEGIEKGFFKPTNIRMSANLIKMLIDSWILKRWDLRKNVSLEETRKGILDMVFNGIMKSDASDKGRKMREIHFSGKNGKRLQTFKAS